MGSKTVTLIAAAGTIALGVVTGNPMLIAQGVLMGAGALMAPKAKDQARQASVTSVQIGEVPRQAISGEAATAGSLLDAWNHGGEDGTDWETLRIAVADHECEALTGFYVNDAFEDYAGDGEVAGYRGQLRVYWLPGTEGQALPAWVTDNSDYTAADNGAGVAQVIVAYKADDPKQLEEDELDPVWPGGRPRFLFVVKGKKCYDPRLDGSLAGGAGAHRWDDPATWEWTDNAAVCRYNWVRGIFACDRIDEPDMLLIGRGLSAAEAPPEKAFAWANLCDEGVALKAGGTEPRYRVGAVIAADEPYIETEERFAAAMAGVIVQPDGSVEVEPGHAKAVVAAITDDDLVVGTGVRFSNFRSKADGEWVNTVVPRYVEPTQKWADHAAPIRRDIADVAADGGPREEMLSLSYVTSGTQAQRCGEIRRRLGRLGRTATITLGPTSAGIEEGDWIEWTSARRTGGLPATFRVESYALGRDWRMTLQLREIHADAFDWDEDADELTDGAVAVQPAKPAWSLPKPGKAELQGRIRNSYPIGLVLTGQDNGGTGEIVVSAHERDYPGLGTVAMAGTTISGLALGAKLFPFMDYDPTEAAAPVYGATATYADALDSEAHPYRTYLGQSVTMPALGAADTAGVAEGGGYGGGERPGVIAGDVAFTPTAGVAADNVQEAIVELDEEKEPVIAAGTAADYWRGDKSWQPLHASVMAVTPTGDIAAGTVQAALAEIDGDKAPKASPTFSGGIGGDYLRLTNPLGATLASTLHAFQIGATNAVNLAVGVGTVQSRFNGAASTLYLNDGGGNVSMIGAAHVFTAAGYTTTGAIAAASITSGGSSVATLDGGGKVPTSQLPALALTDVFVVASQAAQLALTAQEGDVAVRTDLNKSYIHNGGTAGTMADWQELLTPTDTVLSVNGETGAVSLIAGDIPLTPTGGIAGTTVQAAIAELDAEKANLAAFSAFSLTLADDPTPAAARATLEISAMGANLVPDAIMSDSSAWSGQGSFSSSVVSGFAENRILILAADAAPQENRSLAFSVEPSKGYFLSGAVSGSSAGNATVTMAIEWYSDVAATALISTTTIHSTTAASFSTGALIVASPATARKAKILLNRDALGANTSNASFTDPIVQRLGDPVFTVAQLNAMTKAGLAGVRSYCSNEAGGAVPVFCDGTDWRRVTDRAVIA